MHKHAALLLCVLVSVQALASNPREHRAVLVRGERLSRMVCAQCHVVADDQGAPLTLRDPTPSFREIANRPETSARGLRRFITRTHGDLSAPDLKTPDPDLVDEQVTAVIECILSLRRQ